ncbi:MAG: monovalent cation/H(+) antiporter subunit G [Fimbriimonadaceae bacterium]
MTVQEWITSVLMILGSVFCLISAIGLVRLPDAFMRMQAVSKAATFGVGLIMLSLFAFAAQLDVDAKTIVIIVFVFITTPLATHMLSRAAYFEGVKMMPKAKTDELEGRYDPDTHILSSNVRYEKPIHGEPAEVPDEERRH